MPTQPSRHRNPAAPAGKGRGFTLLEAMIALVVLSVGLLGLAALQARSMQYNHDALSRSQATALAMDIVDKMRGRVYEVTDATVVAARLAPYVDNTVAATDCPAAPAAPRTAKEEKGCWLKSIQTSMPGATSATGVIDLIAGPGSDDDYYRVTVRWADRNRPGTLVRQEFAFQP